MTDYALLGLITIAGIILGSAVLSSKYIIFNLKLMFKTMIWKKHNVGLIFIRNLGNSFNLPEIVKISDNKSETKDAIKVFAREQFREGTWFGFPYMLADAEDMKTSIGIYAKIKALIKGQEVPKVEYAYCEVTIDENGQKKYNEIKYKDFVLMKAQCDVEGKSETHILKVGTNDKGEAQYINTQIPKLDAIKTSVSINPHLMKTVIAGAALNAAVKDFLDKNRYILYAAGAAALFAAGALFFSYNNQNSIANFCGAELATKTAQVIQVCQNALTNLSK